MGARASENVDDSDAEDDDCVDDVSEQVGLSDRFNLLLVFTHECVASIPAYSLEISKRKCFFFIFISNIFLPFFVFHFSICKANMYMLYQDICLHLSFQLFKIFQLFKAPEKRQISTSRSFSFNLSLTLRILLGPSKYFHVKPLKYQTRSVLFCNKLEFEQDSSAETQSDESVSCAPNLPSDSDNDSSESEEPAPVPEPGETSVPEPTSEISKASVNSAPSLTATKV